MYQEIEKIENSGEIKLLEVEKFLQLGKDTLSPKYTFFVPGYQRGYRWSEKEVIQLLDDISEFQKYKENSTSEFYCLQPVVVKNLTNDDPRLKGRKVKGKIIYELIDGQQRLTTLYLILKWLNDRYKKDFQKVLFQVIYETRDNSEEFLGNLGSGSEVDHNKYIDYYHLYHAYQAINKWFLEKSSNQKHIGELENVILKNVKPIWYEIPDYASAVKVFRNLNVGKIKLTNSELIKALFLSKTKNNEVVENSILYEIANDWEIISKKLLNEKFWYFIGNFKIEKFYRIDFLFSVAAKNLSGEGINLEDPLATFLKFQAAIGGIESRVKMWKEFKMIFLTLESWYADRELYHLIGYLIAEKKKDNDTAGLTELLHELINSSNEICFSRFKKILLEKIEKTLHFPIEDLRYGKHSKEIRNTLLLFNISTLLEDQNSNVFFNFEAYKNSDWDIEHIKSVSSEKPIKRKDQIKWLKGILWFFSGLEYEEFVETDIENTVDPKFKALSLEVQALIKADKIEDIIFNEVYEKVLKKFGERHDEKVDNTIGNLTLLDQSTNRKYGNAIFPLKRKIIIENERKGVFVPVCTKNIFLKLYSNNISTSLLNWNKSDVDDYSQIISSKVNSLIKI